MSKILLVIMLITCLSCNQGEEVKPFEDYQYRTVLKKVEINGEEFVSIKDSICEKRFYRVWTDKVGAQENFKSANIEECFQLFGYRPKPYSNLWALMEYARKQIAGEIATGISRATPESTRASEAGR